MHIIICVSIYS